MRGSVALARVWPAPTPEEAEKNMHILKRLEGRSVDASGFGVGAQRPPGADGCGHGSILKDSRDGELEHGDAIPRVCDFFFS